MLSQDIEFYFSSFPTKPKFKADTLIVGFGFEGREDSDLSKRFPEFEAKRRRIEKIPHKGDEIYSFPIIRDGRPISVQFIYIPYPWRKKKEILVGGLNFLREVLVSVNAAVSQAKDQGYEKMLVILPSKFSPKNVQDEEQRHELFQFVSTVAEAIVYSNNPYKELKTKKDVKIKEVTFTHFGRANQALDGFFRKAITTGEHIGHQLANARRLMELPPNMKTPLGLVQEVIGRELEGNPSEDGWEKYKISPHITAYLLKGQEVLEESGFNLTAAVNRGSSLMPCILRLHYKPNTQRQRKVRRVVIQGKGVVFDTGGYDLKLTGYYEKMEYDMAGAATAWGVIFLAEVFNLPVEIITVTPLVQNMIGPEGTLPGSIIQTYGGKTVEIKNIDAEGRLIIAEAIEYSEDKLRPDINISIGSLGDVSDFGPDFIKVGVVGSRNEGKVRRAELTSAEKVLLLPRIDYLNKVDDMHLGDKSDLINDVSAFHSAPFVFLHNFFKRDPNWYFIDNSALFESDAHEYGVGPGFGIKFIWNLVKQYM